MKSRAILVIMLLFGVFPPMVTTTGCGMVDVTAVDGLENSAAIEGGAPGSGNWNPTASSKKDCLQVLKGLNDIASRVDKMNNVWINKVLPCSTPEYREDNREECDTLELHLQQEYQNHARDFARGKKVYDDCKKQYPDLPDPPELVPPTF